LRFARTEFMRCLEGVFAEDASRRLLPMNCISWIVGHLAYQEHLYWVVRAQGRDLAPDLEHQVGLGPNPRVCRLWMGCGASDTPLPMLLTRIWTRSFGHQRGRPNVCRHTKNGTVSI